MRDSPYTEDDWSEVLKKERIKWERKRQRVRLYRAVKSIFCIHEYSYYPKNMVVHYERKICKKCEKDVFWSFKVSVFGLKLLVKKEHDKKGNDYYRAVIG